MRLDQAVQRGPIGSFDLGELDLHLANRLPSYHGGRLPAPPPPAGTRADPGQLRVRHRNREGSVEADLLARLPGADGQRQVVFVSEDPDKALQGRSRPLTPTAAVG